MFKRIFGRKASQQETQRPALPQNQVNLEGYVLDYFGDNFHLVSTSNRGVFDAIGYNVLLPAAERHDFRCKVERVIHKGNRVLRITAKDLVSGRECVIHTSALVEIQEMPNYGWCLRTANTTYVFAYAENETEEDSTANFAADFLQKGGKASC